mmetsp:Transcript_47079/g.86309  ORF Transcript_47079/g.86309 Transcript_47079/m.86309 type:complete len:291 (-) Transcript_47079:126-998(-)
MQLGRLLRPCVKGAVRALHTKLPGAPTSYVKACPLPTGLQQSHESAGWSKMDFTVSPEDLAILDEYVDDRVRSRHPGNGFDDAGQLRVVHGFDPAWNPGFLDQLAGRALAMLGCPEVYIFQFRVNVKVPSKEFGAWALHRDYDFWKRLDGMPDPNGAILFHILSTEHSLENGALLLVDGSHQRLVEPQVTGVLGPAGAAAESGLTYTIPEHMVGDSTTSPMVGPAGTVFAMHPQIWHQSYPNRSDRARVLATIVFNDLQNLAVPPDGSPRPEFSVNPPNKTWKPSHDSPL